MRLLQQLSNSILKYFIRFLFVTFFLFCEIVLPQNKMVDSLTTVEFKWSNDFQYQTDYYFTNGFAFEVFTPWAKKNPINSILLPTNLNDIKLFSVTLAQNIFTPKAMGSIIEQLNGDRPFAAYLLLGFKKVSFNETNRIRTCSKIEIGLLGPAAFGEEVQNGIHNNIPTSVPVRGWENQISNSLLLNYSLSVDKIFYFNNWFEFSGISSVKLGLPFTSANIGVQTRIGFVNIFPKDFEFLSSKKIQLFLTISAQGSLIGYNGTLQGGLLSESIYTLNRINRFVGYATAGITLIYKKFKLDYVQHFNTPEFTGAVAHRWGYLLFKFRI